MSAKQETSFVQRAMKRLIDITLSVIGIGIASPALAVIAFAIKHSSPGSVLFVQDRLGKRGKVFRMYKFRTMECGAEDITLGRYISQNDLSITPIGRILRRWALDELPQFLNVIKGDMSIVGPRPTLGYQVEKYDLIQRTRLDVRPGITGWAQVNGRNKLTWPERIEFDIWYVKNWNVSLDFRIMLMTLPALLNKEFAFSEEDALVDEIVRFDGRVS